MAAKDRVVLTARSGVTSVEVGGTPYHSPYDPQREAQKFCASLDVEKADVVFLFGWGLGYSGRELLPRIKPHARVIVFEPNEALFKLSRAQDLNRKLFEDPRFEFVIGEQITHYFEEWSQPESAHPDRFLWIEWPPAAALHGHILHSLKFTFKTQLHDATANLSRDFHKGAAYFDRVLANFSYQDSSDAGRLFGRFKDVPLVIVAAGPSLDLNLHHLQEAGDRCFILAIDTALRPLLTAGITPNAVVISNPTELTARRVAGLVPQSVYAIIEQSAHPRTLASMTRRFLFSAGLFPDSLFAKFGFGKSTLEVWQSAATAALDLACRMGANPIILAGHDFAFSRGREYASHTISDANGSLVETSSLLDEQDSRGNAVRTTENFVALRDFFVRKMATQPQVRFINGTEGGILRDSVEVLPLQAAIRRSCKRRLDVPGVLRERFQPQKPSPEALRHLMEVLRSRSRNCTCLTNFLDLVAKKETREKNSAAVDSKIDWGIERVRIALNSM